MGVVREGGLEVELVEVDGGQEENAGAGGDEGVAEDDIPVGEIVEQAPVIPLLSFYQKIIKLHREFTCLGLILSLAVIYQVSDHKYKVEDVRHRESTEIKPSRSLEFSWRAS